MTGVSFDGRGFSVRGQRVHVVGGRAEYSLLDRASWPARLRGLRAAGFNTVVASVPWAFHELRPGRFEFSGDRDLATFIREAGEAGLWVILRMGPNVGAPFGGGGLPGWLADIQKDDGRASFHREADSDFLEAVTRWWTALGKQVMPLQPNGDHGDGPSSGPLLSVQIEHEWSCGNEAAAQAYLGELVHMIRELGMKVPLLTANGFWQELEGTVETWTNDIDDPKLFANARQLHVVQPNAPRIVTIRGGSERPESLGAALLNVVAAGGMPIVDDAVAGVHRGTIGSLGAESCSGTALVPGSIIDVHGEVVASASHALLVARFCRAFSHVLADLDPNLDAPVIEPGSGTCSVVARKGNSGDVMFMLGGSESEAYERRIVLNDGRVIEPSMSQPGAWCLMDVDLGGRGRLNHTNVSMLDLVARRILVAHGTPGSVAKISIDGSELELTVPAENAPGPEVVEHRNFMVVLCNTKQAGAIVDDGESVWCGALGFDMNGDVVCAPGFEGVLRISQDGLVESVDIASSTRRGKARTELAWSTAALTHDVDGTSDRFATLNGPTSMDACGVQSGYGWYRIGVRATTAGKRLVHFPEGPHRLVVFMGGVRVAEIAPGMGDGTNIVDLKFKAGENILTVLVEKVGGADHGNRQVIRTGLYEPAEVLERLKNVRSTLNSDVAPIDVFATRAFIPEAASGDRSSTVAVKWTFTHRKKSPLRVHVNESIPGSWLLNDTLLLRTEDDGPGSLRLDPKALDFMKAGKNELIFRPDGKAEERASTVRTSVRIYEVIEELGATDGSVAFSTCVIPDGLIHGYRKLNGAKWKKTKLMPSWNRAAMTVPRRHDAVVLDLSSMTRGMVYVDGRELGCYDVRTVAELPVPASMLTDGGTIDVFDAQGADPRTIAMVSVAH